MDIASGWAGAGSSHSSVQNWSPVGREAPMQGLLTHLQESVDLLLFVTIHIPFLKELEVGDKTPTWPDIPTGNIPR